MRKHETPLTSKERTTRTTKHKSSASWDADGGTILYFTPHKEDAVEMIEIRTNVTETRWDTIAFIEAIWPGAQANAWLIAAAPEMLAELRELKECCLEALITDWDKGNEGFTAMLGSIDAILSKATQQSE
jgi:hypothetical protein